MSGGDYRDDLRRAAELKKREDDLRAAGFTKRMVSGGGSAGGGGGDMEWFHTGKKLGAGAVGASGTMASAAKPVSRPLGVPAEKWGTPIKAPASTATESTTTSTSTPTAAPASTTASSTAAPASSTTTTDSSGSTQTTTSQSDVTSDAVIRADTQPVQMANLTSEMDLTNKLTEIINTNSPLFKAAQTKALQAMQARGIVNSSLAQEAVMQSILNVALPIAQEEVQALQQNMYYNTDWTNKDIQQANDYQYNSMLTKLQGRINQQLQEMVQSFAAWGKYGDWITQIITQEGADQDAWQRMLDAIQGAGGWPTISQFS
jgi:hypothetical protein